MSTKFDVGEQVYVPAASLKAPDRQSHALVKRKVLEQRSRSIVVDDSDGDTVEIASSRVHAYKRLGFLILKVGDFQTEPTLLDPLAKSSLQFLRLLVPDHDVESVSIRTISELSAFWQDKHASISHVVLIGHSDGSRLSVTDAGAVTGGELAGQLRSAAGEAPDGKFFISLCCRTGRADFAKPFSLDPVCSYLAAPFQPIHGAVASHFCQSLLVSLLLEGMTPAPAFKRSAEALVGGTHFRLWNNGELKAGRKINRSGRDAGSSAS